MKKTLLFAFAAAALFASCAGNETKTADVQAEGEEVVALPDSAECVQSGDVVYVDLDAMFKSSKIFAAEGKPLEEKVAAFQKRMVETQEDLAQREQGLAYEQNKIAQESAKLQSDYQKGLITTLNAQTKGEELEKRAQNLQASATSLQKKAQQESEALQKEEQELANEHAVLENRFAELLDKAIAEINADGRYKMIVNSMVIVNAAEGLNISSLVLTKIDELYEAGAITKL